MSRMLRGPTGSGIQCVRFYVGLIGLVGSNVSDSTWGPTGQRASMCQILRRPTGQQAPMCQGLRKRSSMCQILRRIRHIAPRTTGQRAPMCQGLRDIPATRPGMCQILRSIRHIGRPEGSNVSDSTRGRSSMCRGLRETPLFRPEMCQILRSIRHIAGGLTDSDRPGNAESDTFWVIHAESCTFGLSPRSIRHIRQLESYPRRVAH